MEHLLEAVLVAHADDDGVGLKPCCELCPHALEER